MTSKFNSGKFATRPKDEAEDITGQSDQSNQQGDSSSKDPSDWKQRDSASEESQASSETTQPGDPLLRGAAPRMPGSSKYHFTHDQLSHPDE
ncbi:hypothetical protein EYZ11_006030 [Aspergillus tanneri]|uniref:Uncharacterized protein n=1 Tax=Aspergillus tanneri TaxID=1220188 RepID=A0A4S3JIU5_9EURO|nr:uncharacterized protein ATNIH1004_000320 [Aspergillus tanneri]KAA8651437.1 hypothetical protein ATNIH1004_000320 [Aspergillus tanneri]THC94507.1 hypothetical protein EYZ11_006030 [Aspergillus tanneri]